MSLWAKKFIGNMKNNSNKQQKLRLHKVGENGDYEQFEIVSVPAMAGTTDAFVNYADDPGNVETEFEDFTSANDVKPRQVKIHGKTYDYIPNGSDDNIPFTVLDLLGRNVVADQSLNFDCLTCYAKGIHIVRREDMKDTDDKEIRDFCLRNAIHECFLGMVQSMKYYLFCVMEIILNRKQDKIVKIRHLDSTFCRFEKRNKKGKIEHVFYGDFGKDTNPEDAVAIQLLDTIDPYGDIMQRLGREPNENGKLENTTKGETKFAIAVSMPKPGSRYYDSPTFYSLFRDVWYDLCGQIGKNKRYKMANVGGPRMQIEVHKDYWTNLCMSEGITDPLKQKERIAKEQQMLIDFATGPKNGGKAIVSEFSTLPGGGEVQMIRINDVGSNMKKEGGDWVEDFGEAANSVCYAFGVHPSLVGATPGKSQMNNSGSDKRELFNLKQITQEAFHNIMARPFHIVLHFNGWDDKNTIDIPLNQLTTLDENKSHKKVSQSNREVKE